MRPHSDRRKGPDITPEFQLVAACCRWPDDAGRSAAVTRAAPRGTNWEEVVRLAHRHRVEPLVGHGLTGAGLAVPESLAALIEAQRAASLRDIGETLRIAAALASAGITHRFLKGAALGVASYGSPLLKHSWDVDLLVLPRDAVAAAAVLAALDYTPRMPPRPFDQQEFARWSVVSKEAELVSARGTVVELHWRVSDHPDLLTGITAATAARRIALLGSNQVSTLEDSANVAYLAVHGTSHAWARLKWIADFNAFMTSFEDCARADLLAKARQRGVGRAIDCALSLADDLFGDRRSGAAPTASSLIVASRAALAADDQDRIDVQSARARWRICPTLAYRARESRLRLRGSVDRLDHPLPRRWEFLYPAVRIPFFFLRWLRRRERKGAGHN